MKINNRYIFVLVSFCLTLKDVVTTNNNQQSERIKLFENEGDINELMGFPKGFFEKRGKNSPFSSLYASDFDESFTNDVLQILHEESNMGDIFFCFKEYFGKAYKDTEEPKRKSILQNKIEYIFKHNIEVRSGKHRFTLGINQFSDLTFQEFSQRVLGSFDKVNVTEIDRSLRKPELITEGRLLNRVPLFKDWSEFDTPVKDQGMCGSCWAFTTIAVIENHLKKNGYVKDIDLSEQELVDCSKSYGSHGCSGSFLYAPFNYARDRSISHEVYYEYVAKDDECQRQWWWNGKIANLHMTNFTCVQLGENAMRDTVASVGTVGTVVYVNEGFQSYNGGLFDNESCNGQAKHAVAISGYNYGWTSKSHKWEDYWIIKNSWGVTWGENGYMKLARGKNRCGIGTFDSCYPHIIKKSENGDSCHDELGIKGTCHNKNTINKLENNMSKILAKRQSENNKVVLGISTPITVVAAGRVANFGDLYDARTDNFLSISLFHSKLANTSITSTQNKFTSLQYTLLNTYEEKFRKLGISAELKLSILGGMVSLDGSARYFKDTKRSAKSAKASLIQSISTEYETISITENNIRSLINFNILESIDATHVVIGIQWGGRVIISVEDDNKNDFDQQTIEGKLKAQIKKIASGIVDISGDALVNISDSDRKLLNEFNFEIFGDILPDVVPENLIQGVQFMKSAPSLLQKGNDGKGKAMKFTLIPVSILKQIWKVNTLANSFVKRIGQETVEKCVKLFDNMNLIEQKLNDYYAEITQMEKYIKTDEVEEITDLVNNYNLYQAKVRENLSKLLILVRSGNETVDKLEEILLQSLKDPYSWENIKLKLKYFGKLKQEISFIKLIESMNVTMLKKNTIFEQFLLKNFINDLYILFYNYEMVNESDEDEVIRKFWIMLERKQDYGSKALFAAVNYKIYYEEKNYQFNNSKIRPKISLFRNGKCIEENYEFGYKPIEDNSYKQFWSLSYIQEQLLNQIDDWNNAKYKLEYLIKNPVPLGFIYIQLPNQEEPRILWPKTEWRDISSDYAGLFFRVLGNGSAGFKEMQSENSPTLSKVFFQARVTNGGKTGLLNIPSGSWSEYIRAGNYHDQPDGLSFFVSGGEVRPRNKAVRIWIRTK